MGIMCLSETFFDFSIQLDDDNLGIPGYNIVRSDHPSKNKLGDVYIYYKTSLPLRVIDTCILQKYTVFGIMKGEKDCNFVVFYSSTVII